MQGYKVDTNIIYQDDKKSSIKLEKTKKRAAESWRVNSISNYYVTNMIQNGEIEVRYCSTEDMISDFMSKPLVRTSPIDSNWTRGVCWEFEKMKEADEKI